MHNCHADISYRNYTNGSALFMRGYEPGDRLIAGWTGTVTVDGPPDAFAIAERIWLRHNRDDRPDGQLCPSMSVGDVVVIAETALTVESCGFSIVTVDPADVVDTIAWRDWIDTADAIAARSGQARR